MILFGYFFDLTDHPSDSLEVVPKHSICQTDIVLCYFVSFLKVLELLALFCQLSRVDLYFDLR